MSAPTPPASRSPKAPYLSDELTLIADVGTNAEILFGNKDRVLACSSPTGPAFEGAQISCGQRAAPGAIERVRIDRETLEPRFKVIGVDLWSDEPGFAEADGYARRHRRLRLRHHRSHRRDVSCPASSRQDGLFDGSLAEKTEAYRSRSDARTAYVLQRGRAASADLSDRRARDPARQSRALCRRQAADRQAQRWAPQRVTLVGAFGSHIDTTYAMALGLIPDCDLEKVVNGGNSAGTGARIALLNLASRAEIEDVVRRIDKIETAIEPNFQAEFVAAMALPHASDSFDNLARTIKLPERKAPDGPRRRRR